MTNLFNRSGTPRVPNGGTPDKPTFTCASACSRCGGAGGAEKWRPTGWYCFQCGGSGKFGTTVERLYTAERNAVLDAIKAKKHAKAQAAREAADAAYQARRQAERAAWLVTNAEFLAKLEGLAKREPASDDDGERNGFWNQFLLDFHARQVDPSEAQLALVERTLAKIAADAMKVHVGQVGAKVELMLTCDRVVDISYNNFPRIYQYLHICHDQDGNAVIYKGNGNFLGKGESGKVRATVKDHDTYKGIPQTYIQRPKLLEVTEGVANPHKAHEST